MYTFGWLSTGRDEAARELLSQAWENMNNGTIPGRIGFVFCNREEGDDPESDLFIRLVEGLGIPLLCLSSKKWNPPLRERNREAWRRDFHMQVMHVLKNQRAGTLVLAGYMLIVSPEMCQNYAMINLHPAAPGGPKGTWQEVIWELIARGADTTGVMVHLVTEALDEGPPITWCTFPLKGERFDPLWVQMGARLGFMSLGEVVQEEGEKNPLFQEIRRQGVMREIPLLMLTMKVLAEGTLRVEGGKILDKKGEEAGSVSLNREVEAYLNRQRDST